MGLSTLQGSLGLFPHPIRQRGQMGVGGQAGRQLVPPGRDRAHLRSLRLWNPASGLAHVPPSIVPTLLCTSPTLSQGYSIASRHPVVRQEGNQDPKANHSKEEVQQPGHNLERVRGPAPPIPAGPLALQLRGGFAGLCRCCPHILLRGCLVRGLVADVHLQREKR